MATVLLVCDYSGGAGGARVKLSLPAGVTFTSDSGVFLRATPPSDFTGDGKTDILWRNATSGDLALWLMNGATVAGSSVIATVPTAWQSVRMGDFDGNGKADILWRNTTTGDLALWLMNGATVTGSSYIATVATSWTTQ
jgi:hypothetical protein